jgi:putative transcriptional regulator
MLDHAAGALSPSLALAGDLHVLLNSEGREVAAVWGLAGQILASAALAQDAQQDKPRARRAASLAQAILDEACEETGWRRGFSGAYLRDAGPPGGKLIRLGPGRRVPGHGHSRLEATVVLRGAFSDGHGQYQAGELVLAGPGDHHTPMTAGDAVCVCYIARAPGRYFWQR